MKTLKWIVETYVAFTIATAKDMMMFIGFIDNKALRWFVTGLIIIGLPAAIAVWTIIYIYNLVKAIIAINNWKSSEETGL